MKYTHPCISEIIEIDSNHISTLVIENGKLFREIVADFIDQSMGCDGQGVLSDNNKPLDIAKETEIISTFVPLELNSKSITSKLQTRLEKMSAQNDNFMRTQQLLAQVGEYIYDLTDDLPWDIELKKLSASSIIKAVGVEVKTDAQSLAEAIYDYMDIIRHLDKDKLFIFINLRSYLDDKEAFALFKTITDHRFKVLLIDNCEKDKSPLEKRLIIDKDLCEI